MTLRGCAYLTLATLTYGGLHVIDKAALNVGVDAGAYTVARVFVAACFLLVFALASLRPESLLVLIRRDAAKDLLIIGVLASGWGLLSQIIGLQWTTAVNAGVLLTLVAPVTTFFAVLILGERFTKELAAATLLMSAGVASVYGIDKMQAFGWGDFLILVAVIGYGYSNVHARKTMKSISTTVVTLGRLVFGALSIIVLLPVLPFAFSSLLGAPILVLAGGFVFGLRMVAYYKGIELEGAAVAATFLLFSPVVTALSAHVFLGEPVSAGALTGVFLTLSGGAFLLAAGLVRRKALAATAE